MATTEPRPTYLPVLVVDHDVVRLDVAMHHSHAVGIVQRLQQFIEIVAYVIVRQGRVELLEVRVVNVLKHQCWRPGL